MQAVIFDVVVEETLVRSNPHGIVMPVVRECPDEIEQILGVVTGMDVFHRPFSGISNIEQGNTQAPCTRPQPLLTIQAYGTHGIMTQPCR